MAVAVWPSAVMIAWGGLVCVRLDCCPTGVEGSNLKSGGLFIESLCPEPLAVVPSSAKMDESAAAVF